VKPTTLVSLCLTVFALGAGTLAWRQHEQIQTLRHRVLPPDQTSPVVVPPPTPPASPLPGSALTEAEHLERLRLRGQIQPLVTRLAELSGVSNQHARLQAAAAPAAFPPPGYVRRADAQNRGAESPETALETFLWASQQQNTEVLLTLLPPPVRDSLAQQLASGKAPDFFKSQPSLPGFRITGRQEVSPDEVTLTVEVAPGATFPITFQREGAAWRLAP
jgi:hypothetical protein